MILFVKSQPRSSRTHSLALQSFGALVQVRLHSGHLVQGAAKDGGKLRPLVFDWTCWSPKKNDGPTAVSQVFPQVSPYVPC